MRTFHDAPQVGRGLGSFRVERPAGRLPRVLGDLLGFPPAGEEVAVVLQVEIEGKRERWMRSFGGHRLVTVQEAEEQRLVERFGAVSLVYRLGVEEGALVYDLVGMRLFGVPIPRLLSPLDRTAERSTQDGWEVTVRISIPVLGELLRYGGRLRYQRTGESDPG